MRVSFLFAAAVNALGHTFSVTGDAEPLRLHTALGAARPITGHQVGELGWGSALDLGMELPFVPQFGVVARLGVIYLSGGRSAADGFVDPGSAAALTAACGIHLRPFASRGPEPRHGLTGVWLAGSFGGAQTGGLQRFMADASLGYDVLIADGTYALGPYVGLLHVFQRNGELRPEDANVLVFGAHLLFDSADNDLGDNDSDRDGVVDRLDRCPLTAEDPDQFADEDGCPEFDNDQDGINDVVDMCPLQAEDFDGVEDEDGCPEASEPAKSAVSNTVPARGALVDRR